jgi:hypothetical protein
MQKVFDVTMAITYVATSVICLIGYWKQWPFDRLIWIAAGMSFWTRVEQVANRYDKGRR